MCSSHGPIHAVHLQWRQYNHSITGKLSYIPLHFHNALVTKYITYRQYKAISQVSILTIDFDLI